MSEALPVWNCTFGKSTEPNPVEMNALTVGAKFSMACKGDIAVDWTEAPVSLRFPKKEDSYTLQILKTDKLGANEALFVVTGYKGGAHNPEYIRIVQGERGFEVAKPAWEIKSVLKKDQPPQPYPPYGPWGVAFPLWILVAIGLTALFIAILIYRTVRRYNQRSRMLLELGRHKTALSPIHQFYRDARGLRRRLNVARENDERKSLADELNRDFRLYVLREFLIPTLDWSDRAIAEDLRKRHRRVYDQAGDHLKRALRELSRMKAQDEVKQTDVEQLHRMSMDAAERIEQAKETRGRR